MRKMLFTLLIVLCLVIGLFAQTIEYHFDTAIYNEFGIPQIGDDVSDEEVTGELETFINTNIWDKNNLYKIESDWLNSEYLPNIELEYESEVKVTFYGETAGYRNSLGYYTYETGTPPDLETITDITHHMLFPNVEDGTWNKNAPNLDTTNVIPRGRTLNLGKFPAGTTIAWFIIKNGWDRKGNGTELKTGKNNPFYYSDSYLNTREIKQSILVPYIKPENFYAKSLVLSNDIYILGFEDRLIKEDGTGSDRDFDDVTAIIDVKSFGTSLDVNLIDFKTKYVNGNVNINWSTASEVNNKGFILERKTGLSDWEEIASYYTDDRLLGYGSTTEQQNYSYIDTDIIPGNVYNYRISDVDQTNKVKVHTDNVVSISIPEEALNTAEKYDITNIYPNPFNPNTNISFDIATQCDVKIEVYDISGNKVDELMSGSKSAGSHTINWNASQFSTGVYFINFQANNKTSIQKCIFMK